MNRLSFVLPVTLEESGLNLKSWRNNPDSGCRQRMILLLRSFIRMFDQNDLEKIFIVCPEKDCEELSLLVETITKDKRYNIIPELDICAEISEMKNNKTGKIDGWHAQQLIKLSIAEKISTAFYVTLDSDIFCFRPFSAKDLFTRNKALLNIEKKRDYKRIYTKTIAKGEYHAKKNRYRNSSEMIDYMRPTMKRHYFHGETPVIMHTKSVLDLAHYIEKKFEKPWKSILAQSRSWTEYSLYFQFLEKQGILNKIYRKKSCNTILNLEQSVWHATDCYRQTRLYDKYHFLYELHQGFFLAVQSWLPISAWLPDQYRSVEDFYTELEAWILES